MEHSSLLPALTRIAEALERLAPPPAAAPDLTGADAFIWHPEPVARLSPVPKVAAVHIDLPPTSMKQLVRSLPKLMISSIKSSSTVLCAFAQRQWRKVSQRLNSYSASHIGWTVRITLSN